MILGVADAEDVIDRTAWRALPFCAALVVVSLFIGTGGLSSALALPWALLTSATAVRGLTRTKSDRGRSGEATLGMAALILQAIAAFFLLCSRVQLTPFGLHAAEPGFAAALEEFLGLGATALAIRSTTPSLGAARSRAVSAAAGIVVFVPIIAI